MRQRQTSQPRPAWRARFPIAEREVENYESQKSGESLLLFALRKGLVQREEYFPYAMERYQMPWAESDAKSEFMDFPAQAALEKAKEKWSAEFAPLCVWEGIVFIGCLEGGRPPPPFPHRMVLASDLLLAKAFKRLQDEAPPKPKAKAGASAAKSPGAPTAKAPQSALKKASLERGDLSEKTVIVSQNQQDSALEKLWPQVKGMFFLAALFQKERAFLKLKESAGAIALQDGAAKIDMREASFFKILQKGIPYHGPIVEGPSDRAVLRKLSLRSIPAHVSAVLAEDPKDSEGGLVFFGAGKERIDYSKLKELDDFIKSFLQQAQSSQPKKEAA